ncbi:hypothetical protein Tco_0411802, partial [Tanacetum coccineum]
LAIVLQKAKQIQDFGPTSGIRASRGTLKDEEASDQSSIRHRMEIPRREYQLEKMVLLEYFHQYLLQKFMLLKRKKKARTILLMAIPTEHLRRFHGMDNAKEIWEAIRTSWKLMVLKYPLRMQITSFSDLCPQACVKSGNDYEKPDVDTLSIDDLYNNLRGMAHPRGTHDENKKRLIFSKEQGHGKKDRIQNCLLTMDDGVVNWGEHTVEEVETNHALMAISKIMRVSTSHNWGLTPQLTTGIDDSFDIGKKGPQKPETSVSDDKFSENSVTSNEEVVSAPKPKEAKPSCVTHVKTPKQPMKNQGTPKVNGKNWNEMMERKLGEEAELKKQRVFNTGNGVAKPVWNNANRVNHANHFVPRPVQLIAVRQNVNSVRPNVNTGRANVNSVRQNVNSVRSNVNTGSFNVNTAKTKQLIHTCNSNSFSPGNWGTAVKTSAGYNWRKTRPNSNCNSGSNFIRTDHPLKNMEDRGIFDSGCSGHMTGNKDHLDDFEECKGDHYFKALTKDYAMLIAKATSEESKCGTGASTPSPPLNRRSTFVPTPPSHRNHHHSDDEASNHEDASKNGTATNKPKQQQQQLTPTTTTISNIKLPILKKEEILPPVSPVEIHDVEKKRKARTILLMAIPKEHLRRFHGMDDAKEIWEAIMTSSEGLENGYDRFQQLLSQLEAHGAEVSIEDAKHKFLRSLPPAWSNLEMTMRTKPDVDTLSINDLYSNLRVFKQELTSTTKSSASAQNVAFVSNSKSSTNKVKSGHTGAYSTYTPTSSNNIQEREVPASFADEVIMFGLTS